MELEGNHHHSTPKKVTERPSVRPFCKSPQDHGQLRQGHLRSTEGGTARHAGFRQQKWWLNPPKKGDLNIQKIYLLYGNGSKPIPTSNNWMNHLKTTSFTSYDLGCHPGTRRLIHILTYSHESYWTNVAMENGDLLIYPWKLVIVASLARGYVYIISLNFGVIWNSKRGAHYNPFRKYPQNFMHNKYP